MKRPAFPRLAVLLLAATAAQGCRKAAEAPRPLTVSYDLARMAMVADREGPLEFVPLGTPASGRYQAEGFVQPVEAGNAAPFVWARRTAEIRFPGPPGVALRAVVEMAAHPDLGKQSARLLVAGERLGRVSLDQKRRRYLVSIPAGPKDRETRLQLVFARGTPKLQPYRRSLAGAVYSVTAAPSSEATLEEIVPESVPPLVSISSVERVPALVQGGPSILRYAFQVPACAELRFVPALHPSSAGRSVSMRVTLEERAGAEREIWRGRADSQAAGREVTVPLGVREGTLIRLGLHVEEERTKRPVWAVWKAPRILGDGPVLPIGAAKAVDPDTRLDTSHNALSGSNVLFVILDAAGAEHFGCYGYDRRTTPEIDRIASEGILFEQAYTPAAYTLAAMSSVWTSQQPDQHLNIDPRSASLDRARLTLLDVLSSNAVHTAGFVANSMAGPAFGFDRGFSEFREMYQYFGQRADADNFRKVLAPWLGENKSRRFFAYVHYREPHSPYDPPAPFRTMFGPDSPVPRDRLLDPAWLVAVDNRRTLITPDEIAHVARLYDGNLAFVDHEVGVLRKTLESAGLWDRTVVIVTADHGEALGEHEHIGHEVQVYEPSVRIPLIVRFPKGAGPSGLRVKGLVDLLDVAPTIADLFGLLGKGGSDRAFKGRSLLPMVQGAPGKPAVFSRSRGDQPRRSVFDGRYKCIYDAGLGATELYDLQQDPGERENLADKEPIRAAFFRQALQRWVLDLLPDLRGGGSEEVKLSRQQLENLKALGYVH